MNRETIYSTGPTDISNDTPQGAPLRVMFVITSMPVGGAETLLVNLIRHLDRTQFAAELCCLKQKGPLGELLSHEVPTFSNLLSSKYDLRVLPRLHRLFTQRRVDVIVTVGAGDKMFWGRLAAKTAGVPVVLSALHSTGWPDGIGRLNRLLTPLTDKFIAVAHEHGRFLVEHERFPQQKVWVIPNGVDTERFRPNPSQRRRMRRNLGLSPETPVFGIVAALRPEKNHCLFLQAAHQVVARLPHARFLIVGEGPERAGLERMIRELHLDKAVLLLGNRDDIPSLLTALDGFVLTSQNEASPVSILEAMSSELPIVATRVGSVSEVVRHEVDGFIVDREDADALAARMLRLASDDALRHRLGRQGRRRVQEIGSLDAMVQGYQSLIAALIHSKERGDRAASAQPKGVVSL